jgi:hypothetical protein
MTMHPTLHSVLVASPPRRLFLPSYVGVVAISLLTDKFSLLVDRNTSASQLCPQFRAIYRSVASCASLEPYTVELPS